MDNTTKNLSFEEIILTEELLDQLLWTLDKSDNMEYGVFNEYIYNFFPTFIEGVSMPYVKILQLQGVLSYFGLLHYNFINQPTSVIDSFWQMDLVEKAVFTDFVNALHSSKATFPKKNNFTKMYLALRTINRIANCTDNDEDLYSSERDYFDIAFPALATNLVEVEQIRPYLALADGIESFEDLMNVDGERARTLDELMSNLIVSAPVAASVSVPVAASASASVPSNVRAFRSIAVGLADLYERKNANYGNSFSKSVDKYGMVAALTRMSDKWNRLETLVLGKDHDKVGESIKDTLLDLASYAIMTSMELKN